MEDPPGSPKSRASSVASSSVASAKSPSTGIAVKRKLTVGREDSFSLDDVKNITSWLTATVAQIGIAKTISTEQKRSLVAKANELDNIVAGLTTERAELKGSLDENRKSYERLLDQYILSKVDRLRAMDAKALLETEVKEKEEVIAKLKAQLEDRTSMQPPVTTFADVTRSRRNQTVNRQKSRSRSRKNVNKEREKMKRVSPERPFKVVTSGKDVESVKQDLWKEVVKSTRTPKMVLRKNEDSIILKPKSKETVTALREVAKNRSDVTEAKVRWPKIIITGIDDKVLPGELIGEIEAQNPDIELDGRAVPVFKKGRSRKDATKVNWVFEVEPETFKKLNGRVIWLGFDRCYSREYEDVTRCYNCQAYGHIAKLCKGSKRCGKCAGPHEAKDCAAEESSYKCANCGGKHMSDYRLCSVRERWIKAIMRRTDYGNDRDRAVDTLEVEDMEF